MSNLLIYLFISFFILGWLYVAARMIARGVLRSIEEWKIERNKKHG